MSTELVIVAITLPWAIVATVGWVFEIQSRRTWEGIAMESFRDYNKLLKVAQEAVAAQREGNDDGR